MRIEEAFEELGISKEDPRYLLFLRKLYYTCISSDWEEEKYECELHFKENKDLHDLDSAVIQDCSELLEDNYGLPEIDVVFRVSQLDPETKTYEGCYLEIINPYDYILLEHLFT